MFITGRRHSLPNNLTPVVTQNTLVQPFAINNPNYINYRYGRRNSDPSVLLSQALFMPGEMTPQAVFTPGKMIHLTMM